jgi:hypothetical protein
MIRKEYKKDKQESISKTNKLKGIRFLHQELIYLFFQTQIRTQPINQLHYQPTNLPAGTEIHRRNTIQAEQTIQICEPEKIMKNQPPPYAKPFAKKKSHPNIVPHQPEPGTAQSPHIITACYFVLTA